MPEVAATDTGTAPKPAFKVRIDIDERIERTVNERITRHPTTYVGAPETHAEMQLAHYYRQQRLPPTAGVTMADDHAKQAAKPATGGNYSWVGWLVIGAIAIWFLSGMPKIFPSWPPNTGGPPSATWLAPTNPSASGQDRGMQQAMCDEQAAKRRALGLPSVVVWDNSLTCRATGGYTESGRLP